jgi:hypothetical protein
MDSREVRCFTLLTMLANRANVTHAYGGELVCNYCDADILPLREGTLEDSLSMHKETCPWRLANEFCMEITAEWMGRPGKKT